VTVCAYLAAFAVVGHPFNQYWGSMFAPLLCFGFGLAPRALVDLWRASGWSRQGTAIWPATGPARAASSKSD
jgi:hypothetical protein